MAGPRWLRRSLLVVVMLLGCTSRISAASWPTVDCVGGPCAAPNVCVNLDFLYVACVPCGGEDQVCCPPYRSREEGLGVCAAGLACAANPNYQPSPPRDLVKNVCQVPGAPPPATGGLNHQRAAIP